MLPRRDLSAASTSCNWLALSSVRGCHGNVYRIFDLRFQCIETIRDFRQHIDTTVFEQKLQEVRTVLVRAGKPTESPPAAFANNSVEELQPLVVRHRRIGEERCDLAIGQELFRGAQRPGEFVQCTALPRDRENGRAYGLAIVLLSAIADMRL